MYYAKEYHLIDVKAKILNNYGVAFLRNKNLDSAMKCFKESLIIKEKLLGTISLFEAYYNIAGTYYDLGIYDSADYYSRITGKKLPNMKTMMNIKV